MVQILRFMLFFFSVVLLEAGVIRFAPLSMEKSDTVVQQYKPMLDYLDPRAAILALTLPVQLRLPLRLTLPLSLLL